MRFESANGRLIDRRHRGSAPDPTAFHLIADAPTARRSVRTSFLLKKDMEGALPLARRKDNL